MVTYLRSILDIPTNPIYNEIGEWAMKWAIVIFQIPLWVILGSVIGYLVVANIAKLPFYKIEQIKRKNYATDSEFFEAVGKTFKAKPKFFMESIHRRLSKKVGKKYGDEKRRAMERYIIEHFCLYNEEKILFECDGSIDKISPESYKLSAQKGAIFITNQRIFAQGKLRTAALSPSVKGRYLIPVIGEISQSVDMLKPTGAKRAKNDIVDFSVQQELPSYGYIFPIKNLSNIRKKRRSIDYHATQDNNTYNIKISSLSFKTGENINKLFEILSNEQESIKYYKE